MPPILQSNLRKQIRIKHFDYRTPNYCHIVINTRNGIFYFGKIVDKIMDLSKVGEITGKFWQSIPNHFENVELDIFQVMPNHIHGIVHLLNVGAHNCVPHGVHNCEPLQQNNKIGDGEHRFQHILPKSISSIIRSLKTVVKTWCNQNNYEHFEWQRNFYEHVIRSEKELFAQQTYILNNPLKWEYDRNNPARRPGNYHYEF